MWLCGAVSWRFGLCVGAILFVTCLAYGFEFCLPVDLLWLYGLIDMCYIVLGVLGGVVLVFGWAAGADDLGGWCGYFVVVVLTVVVAVSVWLVLAVTWIVLMLRWFG